jgi:polyferredoxin
MKDRQKLRKGIILISFFLFPATFYYFSPVLIIMAATEGIINGSFIMFGLLFISSLVLGRAFCGWICAAGGCQEMILLAREKRVTKGNYIKWIIWVPWFSSIVILAIRGGGYATVDFFYQTKYGFSISGVQSLITYFTVLFVLIVLPAFIFGRRSFCHHLCWMAPFMIIGRRIRNKFSWPSLKLKVEQEKCKNCHKCTTGCPMSLPVEDMVIENKMEDTECILCGACVDGCKFDAIKYAFFD